MAEKSACALRPCGLFHRHGRPRRFVCGCTDSRIVSLTSVSAAARSAGGWIRKFGSI